MSLKRARWARRRTKGLGRLASGAAALTMGEAGPAETGCWPAAASFTFDLPGAGAAHARTSAC